ncbi:bZIP transcription factor [Diplocarpon rosae]|nr:bZIP transcription factor [Diplocarpon rosae]
MSTSTRSSISVSHPNAQLSCHDPLDSMVDFTEYEEMSYQSPSLSPSTVKSQFSVRAVANTPAALPASSQPDLSGPSHNYSMYKQQTGIPQGAVASTLAVNQMNQQYGYSSEAYLSTYPTEELIDFGTAPTRAGFDDMEEYDASPKQEPAFFYPESSPDFGNPQTTVSVPAALPAQTSRPVGRLWPGMHQQQAALAKAQAQQKQQQQIIQQQRQAAMPPQPKPRARGSQAADPIVEEKISQLLNSMRHGSVGSDDASIHGHHMSHVQRSRKDEEDMDEDERLLASEEGKKLSSKERRQLRNKVSARAFRSRRKEYIGQLEGEIAVKLNENTDLRAQNRALMEENTRLSDLTRMLLSSPSFSGFLDTLASNPAAAQTAQAIQQPPPPQGESQPQGARKDVNPYAGSQPMPPPPPHIGMTMIPEQNMDFSMLVLNPSYSFQPQVFSVLSLPETVLDPEILSGKSTCSFSPLSSDDEKVELPTLERIPAPQLDAVSLPVVVDEEFDADPAFALYAAPPAAAEAKITSEPLDLSFLNSLSPKPAQYELVSKTDDEAALRRVERLTRDAEACVARLTSVTMHL